MLGTDLACMVFLNYDFWERPILINEKRLLKGEKKDYLYTILKTG